MDISFSDQFDSLIGRWLLEFPVCCDYFIDDSNIEECFSQQTVSLYQQFSITSSCHLQSLYCDEIVGKSRNNIKVKFSFNNHKPIPFDHIRLY